MTGATAMQPKSVQRHTELPAPPRSQDGAEKASPVCDVCDETIDLAKDKYARNEIPTCIPYCAELEGWTCESCREAAYDRHIESFYG